MEEIEVDLAVIGAGPGGQKAAIQGAKLGHDVLVIDREPMPGGACLFSGTIPSKSLREAVLQLTGFYERSYYGREREQEPVTISDLNYRLSRVLSQESLLIARQFRKNGIRFLHGQARFENAHMLIIEDEQQRLCYHVTAESIVIATGSQPRNPIQVPFDDEVILDSTRLLSIDQVPKDMLVLGGGIIGSEYASFFSALGTEVTVVDRKSYLLPYLDKEIGRHLQTALTGLGLRFVGGKEPQHIQRIDSKAEVTFKDGSKMQADVLLYALGRMANVEGLHIENAGLTVNERGHIPVNALFQTSTPNIYAVGDVIGGPALASTSMEQGRLAARHALGEEAEQFPKFFPVGIYTIPEISSCGATEYELEKKGYRYEVGRAYYYELARSHISGDNVGLVKILFHSETLEVLGVHIVGRGATEVIHIGQVAMTMRASLEYFIKQVFNYPTYAEGYRVAALNGLNKVRRPAAVP